MIVFLLYRGAWVLQRLVECFEKEFVPIKIWKYLIRVSSINCIVGRFLILRCDAYFDLNVERCGVYEKKYSTPDVYACHIYNDIFSIS